MQAVRIWPWDQASYNRPRAFRLLRMHTGTGFRSICVCWPAREFVKLSGGGVHAPGSQRDLDALHRRQRLGDAYVRAFQVALRGRQRHVKQSLGLPSRLGQVSRRKPQVREGQ